MDTFETTMKAMKEMAPAQAGKAVEDLKGKCICGGCPSYTRSAKNARELLFCATGKSFMCIPSEKECLCPNCPAVKDLGLKYTFFCTRGAEKAQRYEHAIWGTKMV